MKDSQNPLSALISFKHSFEILKKKCLNNRGSHFSNDNPVPLKTIECDFILYFRIVLKIHIIFMFYVLHKGKIVSLK